MKKRVIILVSAVFALIVTGISWHLIQRRIAYPSVSSPKAVTTTTLVVNPPSHATASTHGPCVNKNEIVTYTPRRWGVGTTTVAFFVVNQKSGATTTSFVVEDARSSYHPIELHRCGVYIRRVFDFDWESKYWGTQYRTEFWKYDYRGAGDLLFLLDKKEKSGNDDDTFSFFYSPDFRVSPDERYVALTRGFPGKPDFALILKNLKTLNDDFVFPIKELFENFPDLYSDISFLENSDSWSSDGRYFWASTHDGAIILSFIRIDTQTRKAEIFPAPPDVLGGDALNPDTGDITRHPGNVWYGVEELRLELEEERRREGIGTELWIHNLVNGRRSLVASTTAPNAYFVPRWISSTTLQYFIPNPDGTKGERREFVLVK